MMDAPNSQTDLIMQIEELLQFCRNIPAGSQTLLDQNHDFQRHVEEVSTRFSQLATQVKQLLAEREEWITLAEIDKQINSSLNPEEILKVVLDTIIRLTGAERCFLVLQHLDGEIDISIGRNWKQESLSEEEKAFSSTIINQVISTGQPVLTTNAQEDPRFDDTASVSYYGLRSIMCVPLKAQNTMLGAIYADHRLLSNQFTPAKLETLNKFANQAAIALNNARLYASLKSALGDLQIAHKELEDAYQSTLEGWAKALELRDESTEGHTQRVSNLAVKLASALGVKGEGLVNIRRGAILHDIGKMAIPDEILLKPGPLSQEERAVMQQHPKLAVSMLERIRFLRGVLEIPYLHHERWDGNGYPLGLAGEQIPLSARIFAVVDVWDAMTSDRPYRKALQRKKTLDHIRKQSGAHFDPAVVEIFLDLIESDALDED